MKVFAILVIAALAAAAGYLCGTEQGRQRRQELVGRVRKGADATTDAATAAVDAATDAVDDVTEQIAS